MNNTLYNLILTAFGCFYLIGHIGLLVESSATYYYFLRFEGKVIDSKFRYLLLPSSIIMFILTIFLVVVPQISDFKEHINVFHIGSLIEIMIVIILELLLFQNQKQKQNLLANPTYKANFQEFFKCSFVNNCEPYFTDFFGLMFHNTQYWHFVFLLFWVIGYALFYYSITLFSKKHE